ncbi:hypothetical protein GCM10027084_25150 [Pseudoxanthomonas sangjuensis]|uniref:DUF4124 domain-containing protein n=1 Tax=Pseudoxanthomonas sangjuensis TaxID=1503750 RepID=UPI001390E9F7|nr:DUF4124 domain-containing protein [Pseudoxanthomonas sangjuensis]KAF1714259.1 hypothetical protein CSC71_04260 [Pseudoxanthomonas sangjuensis]
MKQAIHLAAALLLATATASADEVAIYRCTDAHGALTVQNMPCPKGMKQEKKIMQGLPAAPAAAPPPAMPMPAPAAPGSFASTPDPYAANPDEYRILDSADLPAQAAAPPPADAGDRLPPPVLFECHTYDNGRYISEDAEPAPRCVPLRTVGLDGNPNRGAGEACEMKRDQCARVPDGALCGAWKQRLGETEVAWRFGRAENAEKNKAEFERVQRIVNESTCALQ